MARSKFSRRYSDSDFNWRSQTDEGQVDAINQGLTLAQKKFGSEPYIFSYLNSDDTLEAGALQSVAQSFKQNPTKQWLVGDAKIINAQNKEIQQAIRLYKKIWRYLWQRWPATLYLLNPIPQPATFISSSLIKKVGSFDLKLNYAMDYDYWLRCSQEAGLPIFSKKTLANFRIHQTTKGTTGFKEQFQEQLAVASNYTQQKSLLKLHHWHKQLISFIYERIK